MSLSQLNHSPQSILRRHLVPGKSRIFHVGHKIGARANAMSAMARAFNVAHAIEMSVDHESRVAIVGGGITGFTIAYSLKKAGFGAVTIYEKSGALLPNFSTASHRYIHPFLYDWPSSDWRMESFEYAIRTFDIDNPRLTWKADFADKVRGGILPSMEAIDVEVRYIEVKSCVEVNNIVTVEELSGVERSFDYIVICPGLGPERGLPNSSYWIPHSTSEQELVIVGNGDGAVIDAMRFLIDAPTEEHFYQQIMQEWSELSLDRGSYVDGLPEIKKCESMVSQHFTLFPLNGRTIEPIKSFVANRCPILLSIIRSKLYVDRRVRIYYKGSSFYRLSLSYIPIMPLNFVLFEALMAASPGSIYLEQGVWDASTGGILPIESTIPGPSNVTTGKLISYPNLLVRVGVDQGSVLFSNLIPTVEEHPDDGNLYGRPKKFLEEL